MARLDIGQEIVANVLETGDIKPFLDRGWNTEWVNDQRNIFRVAVFPEPHGQAWRFLLSYWGRHGKVPTHGVFRLEFPEESYELPEASRYTPQELLDLAGKEIKAVAATDAQGDLTELIARGDWDGFAERAAEAARVMREQDRSSSIEIFFDGPSQSVESYINRDVKKGVMFGIPGIDNQPTFNGYQPGDLITYLGRAKAGKTSFALLTAFRAWERGKKVMAVTFEIDAKDFDDRLKSMGAGVGLTRLRMGQLKEIEKRQLTRFVEEVHGYDETFSIIQPTAPYSIDELNADIDRHEPDFVLIDGFYFMVDRATGKAGSNWEGHDGLSADIKRACMRTGVSALVTHQVREKQVHTKRGSGIDDNAMMGGTGLVMASTYVFGLDAGVEESTGEYLHVITNPRSRNGYLNKVQGVWNWETTEFEEREVWVESSEGDDLWRLDMTG